MRRDIQKIDDDICRKKRIIEQMLYNDPDIIEILDDTEIDPSTPEESVYSSIWPCVRVPGAQDISKSHICFTVDDIEQDRYNPMMKTQYIQFVIFVHNDVIQTKYGVSRHDLLSFLIRDLFNYSNKLGAQLKLVYNREGTTDVDFVTRTMKFEMVTGNSVKPVQTNPHEYNHIIGHRG